MTNQMDAEIEFSSNLDEQVSEKLLELESQLLIAQEERDNAIKLLDVKQSAAKPLNKTTKSTNPTNKSKDSQAETVLRDYKLKIDNLMSNINEFKKKEVQQKNLKNKVVNQEEKITTLQSDIKKIRQQKFDLAQKMRDEAEKLQKSNTSKQKEIFLTRQKLFKKNVEVVKLQHDRHKLELRFKQKLVQLMKNSDKFSAQKTSSKVKNSKKNKFDKEKLSKMDIEEFIDLLEGYTNEIYYHVDLDQQMEKISLSLKHLNKKMDNYLTEISKIKINRDKCTIDSAEQIKTEDKLYHLEQQQIAFETEANHCKESIEYKIKQRNNLENLMVACSGQINQNFGVLLNFLVNTLPSGTDFWETTLNYLFNQLEKNKQSINLVVKKFQAKEVILRDLKKDLTNYKRVCGGLESEKSRMEALIDQQEVEIYRLSNQNTNSNKSRNNGATGMGIVLTKTNLNDQIEKNESYIKNLKLKLAKSEKSHLDTSKLMESYREKYQAMKAVMTRDNRVLNNNLNLSFSRKESLQNSSKKFDRKKDYGFMDERRESKFKHSISLNEIRLQRRQSSTKETEGQVEEPGSARLKNQLGRLTNRKKDVNVGEYANESILDNSFDSFYQESNDELTPYENTYTIDTELPVHSMCDLGDKIATNSKKFLNIYDLEKNMKLIWCKEYEHHLHNGIYSSVQK